jgi:GAF domain-containing protein
MRHRLIPCQADGVFPQGPAEQEAAVTPLACSDDGSVLSTGALAESMRAAMSGRSIQDTLQVVIGLAVDTAPCDHTSITMLGPGRTVQTVVSSNYRASKADLVQYELYEGPCLDAVLSEELILVENLADEHRWPRWTPLASGFGIGSLLSLRLFTDTALGAINLYSELPRDYDDVDMETARVVAAHASVILAHICSTEHLRRAIDTRTLIGQAQGIMMAR